MNSDFPRSIADCSILARGESGREDDKISTTCDFITHPREHSFPSVGWYRRVQSTVTLNSANTRVIFVVVAVVR